MREATRTESLLVIGGLLLVVIASLLILNHMNKYSTWTDCRVTKIEGNIVYVEGPRDNIYSFATLNPEKYHVYDYLKLKVKTNDTESVYDDEILYVIE